MSTLETTEYNHLHLIQEMLNHAALFREELAEFTRTIDSVAYAEGKLVDVQESLSDKLRVLQQSGQLDAALHGLTAAIHLITGRHRPLERDAAA